MLKSLSNTLVTSAIIAIATLALSVTSLTAAPKSTIRFNDAANDAHAVASMNSSWTVMRASGVSMEPYFGNNSILLVDTAVNGRITTGMIVVYEDTDGTLVGHKVMSTVENGFITRGINNDRADPQVVTMASIKGVIFGVLNTAENAPAGDTHTVVMGKSR
ncbi:MAG: S24/S26 family peptidase [Verrucomicrobiota bacterium]|nr:S24/S26 family peptidase [Verrucomicrobiota bacterium]